MTVIGLLLMVLGVVVIGSLAYWVITKFLPPPAQMVALAIVGVLLLLVLLYAFFPSAVNTRVW